MSGWITAAHRFFGAGSWALFAHAGGDIGGDTPTNEGTFYYDSNDEFLLDVTGNGTSSDDTALTMDQFESRLSADDTVEGNYRTNPANRNQYRYRGAWEPMRVLKDTIPVKGERPAAVEYKYTRHGPVIFEDHANRRAYAVRAAWMELGGAPYLASLRMDQATTWEEFREACSWSRLPGENMVWADTAGRIGWQAVGVAPLRTGEPGALLKQVTLPDGRVFGNGGPAASLLPPLPATTFPRERARTGRLTCWT